MTACGRWVCARPSPSSAECAAQTSNPSRRSIRANSSVTLTSSSTIRTRALGALASRGGTGLIVVLGWGRVKCIRDRARDLTVWVAVAFVLYSGDSVGMSRPFGLPVLHVPAAKAVACTRVGGSVEPHPRAACARAARARSGHPSASGKVQEKVRRCHQSRQRADGARRTARFSLVPGPCPAVRGADQEAAGRGRG